MRFLKRKPLREEADGPCAAFRQEGQEQGHIRPEKLGRVLRFVITRDRTDGEAVRQRALHIRPLSGGDGAARYRNRRDRVQFRETCGVLFAPQRGLSRNRRTDRARERQDARMPESTACAHKAVSASDAAGCRNISIRAHRESVASAAADCPSRASTRSRADIAETALSKRIASGTLGGDKRRRGVTDRCSLPAPDFRLPIPQLPVLGNVAEARERKMRHQH